MADPGFDTLTGSMPDLTIPTFLHGDAAITAAVAPSPDHDAR